MNASQIGDSVMSQHITKASPTECPKWEGQRRSIKLIPFGVWKVLVWDSNILKVKEKKKAPKICIFCEKNDEHKPTQTCGLR